MILLPQPLGKYTHSIMAGIRRTWDKELYAAKARERLERGDNEDNETVKTTKQSLKEEFKAADKDADGPMGSQRAYLNSRQGKLDLESKVGKVQIVKPGEANTSHGAGYWCEVCQCLQKDSVSYLDHINGKKRKIIDRFTSIISISLVKQTSALLAIACE